MLRSYLTPAARTLRRRKALTLVNAIGLTVGLACCALVTVFLQYELSWDDHHADADRILTDYWSSTYSTIPSQGYNGPAFADLFTFERLAGPPTGEGPGPALLGRPAPSVGDGTWTDRASACMSGA